MEYITLVAAILLIDLLALISPGPNFVLTASTALSQSRGRAISTAFGIASGSLIWASAAVLGIASVLETLPLLGLVLKGLGIAYLIYLGVKLLRSKGFQQSADTIRAPHRQFSGFWRGLLVNLTNPKSATYYASVFAAFLTPGMPVWVLIVLVSAVAAMSLAWHCCLGVALSAGRVKARYITVSKSIDRLCGGLLVFLGLKLAWDSR